MRIANSTICFSSKNKDVRKADDIVRHVNNQIPAFSPSYAFTHWNILDEKKGNFSTRYTFAKKFSNLINNLRSEYEKNNKETSNIYCELFNTTKRNKLGNCREKAYLTLGALFANGYTRAMKIGIEMEVGAYDKKTNKKLAEAIIPIDHTAVLTTMNNPKRKNIKHAIVADAWLNKAMNSEDAKKEYKKFVSDLEIYSAQNVLLRELQNNPYIDLNNIEFRNTIEFTIDKDFTKEEAESLAKEILKKYPKIKLDKTI